MLADRKIGKGTSGKRMSDMQERDSREAEPDDGDTAEAPQPQPEQEEPTLVEPTPRDLSKRDYFAIFIRGGKESLNDHITNLAAALAYYAFLSIPSLLLVAVGVFSLVGDADAVDRIIQRLEGVAPQEALRLLEPTLDRVAAAGA